MFEITILIIFSLGGNAQDSDLAHSWRMEKYSEIKPNKPPLITTYYCNITQIPDKAFLTFCVISCHLDMSRLTSHNVNFFPLIWKDTMVFCYQNCVDLLCKIFEITSKMHYITSFSFNNATSKMRSNLR